MPNTSKMNLPQLLSTDSSGALIDKINTAFQLIDLHTHISGKGVKVPFTALNANGNLNFLTKKILNVSQINLSIVSRESDAGNLTLFVNNGLIKFKDANGDITNLGQAAVPMGYGSDFPNNPVNNQWWGITSGTTRDWGIYQYKTSKSSWDKVAGLGGGDSNLVFVSALPSKDQDPSKYYVLRQEAGGFKPAIYTWSIARNEFLKLFGNQTAAETSVDASGFNKNLAATDNDLQKVSNKVDALVVGRNYVVSSQAPSNPEIGQYVKYSVNQSALANHVDEAGKSVTTATKGSIFEYRNIGGANKWQRRFNAAVSSSGTRDYAGVWQAGVYAKGQIVTNDDKFFIANMDRLETDTTPPVDDRLGWREIDRENIYPVLSASLTLGRNAQSGYNGVDTTSNPLIGSFSNPGLQNLIKWPKAFFADPNSIGNWTKVQIENTGSSETDLNNINAKIKITNSVALQNVPAAFQSWELHWDIQAVHREDSGILFSLENPTLESGNTVVSIPITPAQYIKYKAVAVAAGSLKMEIGTSDFPLWVTNQTNFQTEVLASDSEFAAGTSTKKAPTVKQVEDNLVKKTDLEGHENDFFGTNTNGFLGASVVDKRYTFTITTDESGVPQQANELNPYKLTAGERTLVVAKTMWGKSDENDPEPGKTLDISDFAAGKKIYLYSQDPFNKDDYFTLTCKAGATLAGSGNGAYIYVPVTVTETGDVSSPSNWWRLAFTEPSDLDLDLPVSAISGLIGFFDTQNETDQWFKQANSANSPANRGEFQVVGAWVGNDPTYGNKIEGDNTYALPVGIVFNDEAIDGANTNADFETTKQFAVGDTIYLHPDGAYSDKYLVCSITAVVNIAGFTAYKVSASAPRGKPVKSSQGYWKASEFEPRVKLNIEASEIKDPQNLVRNAPSLSVQSKLVVKEGDGLKESSIEETSSYMRPRTTAPKVLNQTWETTQNSVTKDSQKIGFQILPNGDNGELQGQLLWGIPSTGLGGLTPNEIEAFFNLHHTIDLKSGNKFFKARVVSFFKYNNVYYITFEEGTSSNSSSPWSPFSDGNVVQIDLQSDLVSRDEIDERADPTLDNIFKDISANTTLEDANFRQIVRATGGNSITITLPDITGDVKKGWRTTILNNGTGDVTIDGNSSDTIDGNTTYVLKPKECVEIIVTGSTTWKIINNSFVKSNSISHTDPTESKIPSNKAVSDYVKEQIGDGVKCWYESANLPTGAKADGSAFSTLTWTKKDDAPSAASVNNGEINNLQSDFLVGLIIQTIKDNVVLQEEFFDAPIYGGQFSKVMKFSSGSDNEVKVYVERQDKTENVKVVITGTGDTIQSNSKIRVFGVTRYQRKKGKGGLIGVATPPTGTVANGT